MLYVFHVDTGTMLTLDMNLAMDTVSSLQEFIARLHRIPADKQVLLISGGENLDPTAKVCSYSAGTDTNPIYLFSKSTIEAATPPSASVNYGSESDLRDQVEGSLYMSATYETVVTRAQLALQFHDVSKEELRVCERLVHDQHLQHQGWAAVIANLEDITSAFKARADVFKHNIEAYLKSREEHINLLLNFTETISLLGKVPLLPCLVAGLHSHIMSGVSSGGIPEQPKYLLDWISAQDSRNSLEQMTQLCLSGLQQMDEKVRETLLTKIDNIMEAVSNQNMKEVKGLEDRLYGLEQLLFGARKIREEQGDMAQGFVQNQNRARNLQDQSVLPDLCNSHKRQLEVMLKNHQNLRDIRRRCTAAKEELSVNLHTRLRWVMYVEESICEVDGKLVIHHETLKKLKRKLEIIQQMKVAPDVYASAVVEVVRRKNFTQHFLEWAGSIAEESSSLQAEEVRKREEFDHYMKHHFLQTLFPGLHDMPPPFAAKAPEVYDQQLPAIQPEDIDFLRGQVPELADKLKVPDDIAVGPKLSTATLKGTSSTALVVPTAGKSAAEAGTDADADAEEDVQVISDIVVLDKSGESMVETHLVIGGPRTQSDGAVCVQRDGVPSKLDKTKTGSVPAMHYTGSAPAGSALAAAMETVGASEKLSGDLTDPPHILDLELPDPPDPDISEQAIAEVRAGRKSPLRVTGHAQSRHKSHGVDIGERPLSKVERREAKSSAGTSPDLDDLASSEGFTTADFFIDESMPSSMTESAVSRKVAELQLVIQEKTSALESRDKELQSRLSELKECHDALLAKHQELQQCRDILEQKDKELREQQENEQSRTEAGTQFQECKQQLKTRDTELQECKQQIESRDTELQECKQQLESRDRALQECKQQIESRDTELQECKQQLKIRDTELQECKQQMESRDTELQECKQQIESRDTELQESRQQVESREKEFQTALDEVQGLKTEIEELKSALHSRLAELEASKDDISSQTSQLASHKNQLVKVEESFKLLHDLAEKGALQLKCDVLGLEKQAVKERDEFQHYMDTVTRKLVEVINKFEEEQHRSHQSGLEAAQEQHRVTVAELEQQLNLERDKVTDAEAQLETCQLKLLETTEHSENLRHEFKELDSKHESAVQDLRKQLVLENELELEKAKAELVSELQVKEDECLALEAKFEEKCQDVAKHMREKEQVAEQMTEQFQKEKENIVKILEQDYQEKTLAVESQLTEQSRQMDQLKVSHQKSLVKECEQLKMDLSTEYESTITRLRSQLKEQGKLQAEAVQSTQTERDGQEQQPVLDNISLEKHGQIISELKAALQEDKDEAVKQAVELVRQEHQGELDGLLSQLEKDKHDSLQLMKSSLTAEKQVVFNEAVSKVISEKDKVIEELHQKEATLQAELTKSKALTAELEAESAMAQARDREQQTRLIQKRLEEDLASAKQENLQLQSLLQSQTASPSLAQSVLPLPEPTAHDKLQQMQMELKNREDEVANLQQKLMSLSMTTSSRAVVQDKVSITSCSVGDVVLLCLDDRHDHYIVFTVGSTLHFLHSDCLNALGLKTSPGESKKSWVLAEITDKEYCQAKKAQNRFKVPIGTKFYRVKAQPWSRDAALQQQQLQLQAQASKTVMTASKLTENPANPTKTSTDPGVHAKQTVEGDSNQPKSFEENVTEGVVDSVEDNESAPQIQHTDS